MSKENILKQAIFLLILIVALALISLIVTNASLIIANLVWIVILLVFLIVAWKADFIVRLKEYERAVIMRFGKVNRVGGPGWCLIIPAIEFPTIVDLRVQTVDVPKQDVVTQGNIELKIDAVVYLKVKKDSQSVINSVIEVEDYKNAVQLYVTGAIRDVIGGMPLSEVIANTDKLSVQLQKELEKISSGWGIAIEAVEIKDVDIPETVLSAMHAEKAAEQEKLARIERAKAHEEEIAAVRRAAEQLSDKALAYYYVKALEKLGEGRSTKFIFPMELSKLAAAVGGGAAKSEPQIESLFRRYAPALKKLFPSPGKRRRVKRPLKRRKR